jgi:uncharacterized protein involved in exopolysaccharide biosynthesis/Mrp family chromosome partitioning ATPase
VTVVEAPFFVTQIPRDGREQRQNSVGVADIMAFLRSSYRMIGLFTAGFAGLALLYLLLTPPRFMATAEVLTDSVDVNGMFKGDSPPEPTTDQSRVESQMEVAKSNPVALAVVRKFGLADDPTFMPPPSIVSRILSLPGSLLGSGKAASGGATKEDRAAAQLQQQLSVRRIGQSLVIQIAFTANDPEFAAKVTNAITQAYIDQDVAARSEAAQRTTDWLRSRLVDLQQKTIEAQRAAEQFRLAGDKEGLNQVEARAKLAQLEGTSQTYQQVYETFVHKLAETVQRVSYPEGVARIVSPATIPLSKSWPKASLILAFACLVGAGLGTAVAAIRPVRKLLSPGQVASDVGVACLGIIHRVTAAGPQRRPQPAGRGLPRLRRKIHPEPQALAAPTRIPRITAEGPSSLLLRDMRGLRTSLNASTMAYKSRLIGVVAAEAGEGATTVAVNLALLGTLSGTRTLLVDTCVEKPTVSREFAGGAEFGLMQALDEPDAFARLVAGQASRQFPVLPAGKMRAAVTPGDHISTQAGAFQIGEMRQLFDLVIFDLPSLDSSSDARAIAPYLDGVLLVADATSTSIEAVADAADAIRAARGNLLGVVLNKMPAAEVKRRPPRKAG